MYYFLCLIERKKSTDENNLQLCLTSIEPIEPKKKKEGLFLREGELIATVWQYGLSSFFGRDTKLDRFLVRNQHHPSRLSWFEFTQIVILKCLLNFE